ncbi:ABC transporter ATP-binding protein [Desulfosporosinus sp. BICA1-9]|uniref:ABC transporter ATP-binding protein n=1 Tax=Desulfosporosinus sp. BICA1-9 TaxID=1531958 RepID=UPI00054C3358|nr:ABC transporter ATP-binding protein [Desulfosporosinus sp. BICA1-9]KJS50122.1 MAG: ABC transporter ATP-binding protein [Peptococcaceae bacterium BRH_c23]KJS84516.1 MAG: ABC transporter ATP-binding protein [Desulfosporosinus sp. BICA1-9]HBW35000.1 ABC transporter ATP-binding protein [Desulfosporosinus sp.]
MSLIKVHEVTKTYKGGDGVVEALKNINLDIAEGEFLALMGPSGSGKSTLLSVLGGLNPPTSGKLMIDDIDVYALAPEQLADFRHEYVGFVFQQYQLIPYLTALENVMLPLAITSRPGKVQRDMAQTVLDKVGLGAKSLRLPNQLSGGEQNRVAIARAIVNEPAIIFADEPTGSLDSKTAVELLELFQSLNQGGLTIIMVTHNQENLEWVSRAVYIRDGVLES